MFQQQPILVRCVLACLPALITVFAVSAVSSGPTAQAAPPSLGDESIALTSTVPIDLAPDNGTFQDTGVSLPGVQFGSATWGDCNNDTAADVLLTGQMSSTLNIARVYRQQIGGSFALDAVLTDVIRGAAAWGDYDNDGWLDIAMIGDSANGPIAQIWHNERTSPGCAFSLISASISGVRDGAAAWGDYDADGQLDLLLAGDDGSQPVTKLYRNDHGSFIDTGLNLPGIEDGAAVWGDYDNDGFVDLLLTGSTVGGAPLTTLFHNDRRGALIAVQAGLPALSDSAAAWGDYNNDGYLDLLLEGTTDTSRHIAAVYRNNHGTFVWNDKAKLLGSLYWTGAAWGDFDTDGYLDALISTNSLATAYRNEITGSFAAGIQVETSALDAGSVEWGHYDSDRNLDVIMTGQSLNGRIAKIYKYSIYTLNQRPYAPTMLTATVEGTNVTLHWSPPITPDDHTPLAGLSYNFRVGTQPGGIDLVAPMAVTDSGDRLLPALGNAYSSLSVTLRNLPVGQPLYWSAQAVDASFVGSNFAKESVLRIPYRVFFPSVLKDAVSYYTGQQESEPNNTYFQANGVLISGRIYQGVHNDDKDYYSVYLHNAGPINADLKTPNAGTQIQLFYQIADVAHRVGFDPTPPHHIRYNGSPGWYYIYVYTNPAYVGTQAYTLTVTYP